MFRFFRKNKLDENLLNQIEENLILSDLGIHATENIIHDLKKQRFNKDITLEELKTFVANKLIKILKPFELTLDINKKPFIFLIFGTNGSGKTTTIFKLSNYLKKRNYNILLAAGDTFRAGATEQLKILGDSLNIPVFTQNEKLRDSAALIYQAYLRAKNENFDILIADTSGRFSNNINLIDELKKIEKTLQKVDSNLPHESILILDGTLGQASLHIIKGFLQAVKISSLIITKIDSSSKGGALIPITTTLKIPVLFLGTGEKKEDLMPFRAEDFSKNLLN